MSCLINWSDETHNCKSVRFTFTPVPSEAATWYPDIGVGHWQWEAKGYASVHLGVVRWVGGRLCQKCARIVDEFPPKTFLILVCGICKAKSCLGIITNIQQPLDESLVVIFTGMNLDCYSAFSRPTNVTCFKRNIGIDLRQNLFSVGIFAYMSADFVWDLKASAEKNHLRQILPNTFPTAEISADGGSRYWYRCLLTRCICILILHSFFWVMSYIVSCNTFTQMS